MGKIKLIVALLLTAVLLTAGAYLPRIVAALQDKGSIGQADFTDSRSVQLQIRQDISGIGKLAMIDRMSGTIDISPEMANLTDSQVLEAFQKALEPYISAGLIPELSPWNLESRVMLAQVQDMPELSGIFWSVMATGPDKEYYLLDLALDDETGNVLRISFTCESWDSRMLREDILIHFADIYFTELEIPEYQDFATRDLILGENTSGMRFQFINPDYGQVMVDLVVHEHGFYTSFHEHVEK